METCTKTPEKQLPGKPFVSGDTRINRAGRPKKPLSITSILREIGAANDSERFKKLAETLWALALGADLFAIRELINRLEGLPIQSMRISPEPAPESSYDLSKLTDAELEQWMKLQEKLELEGAVNGID